MSSYHHSKLIFEGTSVVTHGPDRRLILKLEPTGVVFKCLPGEYFSTELSLPHLIDILQSVQDGDLKEKFNKHQTVEIELSRLEELESEIKALKEKAGA